LDRATSRNDFDLRDLRKRPMSIYLAINPGDLHLLQALLNLLIEQALNLQTRELPEHNPALKFQVAFILDELAAAGRIPILAQGVAYLPGYNVRLMLVIQAFSQLREIYGQQNAETMMKSLAARIVYAPKDIPEANEISAELGFTTVKARSRSTPALNFSGPKGQRPGSVNVSEQRRPLLLPQELKELGRNREIIFYEGVRPILATKNRYYRDGFFKRRLFPPPRRAIPTGHVRPAPPPSAPPTPIEGIAADTRTDSTLTPTVATATPKRGRRSRKATVEDIERIDSLTLDDLDIDLSQVQLPDNAEGERFTEREMQMAVQSFLASLKER
jgi:type IV secretion system protein VirD4